MRDDVDAQLDLTNNASQADASVDLLICCDVLEHVPDHMQGMRRFFGFSRPAEPAILTVPQKGQSREDRIRPEHHRPAGKLRRFGQDDHVRIFGTTWSRCWSRWDFRFRAIDASAFPPELVKKHVLFPPVLSKHPLATNYRKVFFAKKPGGIDE